MGLQPGDIQYPYTPPFDTVDAAAPPDETETPPDGEGTPEADEG